MHRFDVMAATTREAIDPVDPAPHNDQPRDQPRDQPNRLPGAQNRRPDGVVMSGERVADAGSCDRARHEGSGR